jgi:hypothetical protein
MVYRVFLVIDRELQSRSTEWLYVPYSSIAEVK